MGKTPLERLNERRIALPAKSAIRLIRVLLRLLCLGADVSYVYSFDKKEVEGKQVILLADHATRDAYKYVLCGYPFADPNVVVGYQNIFVKGIFGLLLKGGIIPKKLYSTDLRAVADMLKVLRLGGSLCLFPEGIQSTSGSTHPIFAGTASLLKRAGVTVVLCKSYGSYLVKPRYKTQSNRGHQEFHYEILFTEQELRKLTVDEIDARLLDRFLYNDFEWNRERRCRYHGTKKHPLAQGLENILYRCPKCENEFTIRTQGDHVLCSHCGNDVLLNEYYDLLPASADDVMPYSSIDQWFKHQRVLVGEEVRSPFCYEYACEVYDLHTDKLSTHPYYACGEGTVTITNDAIRYRGTRHGQKVDLSFDIKEIPSFVFTPGQDNDLYYRNTYYSFRPRVERQRVVKYMLLVEEAHRTVDEIWQRISADVYTR